MHGLHDRIQEAADFVRARSTTRPRFGLVLGTGLGDLADAMHIDAVVPYSEWCSTPSAA